MPCSRSARRPSVTKDRSTSPSPRRSDAVSMAVSWSSKSWRVSKRSRPMRVLFPSSTDPMVAKRSRSMVSTPSSGPPAGGEPGNVVMGLEVPLALAVFHGGLREAVVRPRCSALGDPRRRDLADDPLDRVGRGAHCTSAGRITDGTEAHRLLADLFATLGAHPFAESQEHAVALEYFSFVRVIDGRKLDALAPDVLPDVELGPIRQRKRAEVFAWAHTALIQLPQLRSLRFGIPLPERIPEGEDPLLGPGLVLITTCAAKGGIEPVCVDGIEQRRRLQAIPRGNRPRVSHSPLVDGVLHACHNEAGAFRFHLSVPVLEYFGEVVPGVHMQHRERDFARFERLGGQMQQDSRILAPAEEEDRPLGFGCHLADDEDGQRLQEIEVAQGVLDRPDQGGHRSASPDRDGVRGSVVLRGTEGGGGVHGASQIMTILVMYTKACIRTGVKRRWPGPETARWTRGEGEECVAEINVSDQLVTAEDLAAVSGSFESAPASAVIRWAVESFGDSLVLAASFEDIVLIDLVTKVAPAVEVVFLDTEAHFPETWSIVDDMRERSGRNLKETKPGPEAAAHPCGSDQCCQFRKVEP